MKVGTEVPDEGGAAQRTHAENTSAALCLKRPLTVCGRAQKAF